MILRAVLVWLALCSAVLGQVGQIPAWPPLQRFASATYQGPGDIVSGATAWGSCARVYTAAQASTATSLCDLVSSSAPTVTICTLRATATGFVDLSAYCPGSVTPAAICAAATGGVCNVQKVYDQSSNGNHFTNTTASSQPVLAFSALNGLPGLTGLVASATVLNTASLTVPQPLTLVSVYERTAGPTTVACAIGNGTSNLCVGGSNTSGQGVLFGSGGSINVAATESVFHAIQGASIANVGTINVDGTEASNTQATAFSGNALRMLRGAGANTLTGIVMEGGLWPSGFSAGNRTSMNANMHGTSGYNF